MSNEQKKTVKVKLVRSPSRTVGGHRDTVLGLGLKRMNQVRELEDTPAVRGMITKVAYLVKVVD
ncbi:MULTISPECIES: 50S ribosomal protein L30 [Lautropia]|jgi:ribosomal protein L30|uniref:Large ribosomal subunit protein uL30 n=2 Tax=Lautropia TaxID=47670 RepID=E7RYX5_9BURK|nr:MULTISPECIES: 50S ribosomal protein L30 [Lautropia]MDO4636545.1 50S ribosomal protein L30 [Lautropia sp.]EFV94449.1 ribosomal protein L30 [Lautropia mirabilis ATCC 51599]MBF1234353.1 50S ribosomal protein L30 [Lautropia mirabilis]MBF1237695.1 50S ribosomal protein L30 [Lautropia mirabilis]MBF1247214.1 50S ribosomal protein L30 [Lautropia mirabilis]